MSEKKREAKFWSCDRDEEILTATSPDEAIEDYLDQWGAEDLREAVETNAELTVHGYAPMDVGPVSRWTSHWGPLSGLLESIDEEYGNPYGDPDPPTEAMLRAEESFVRAVIDEYESWSCEVVTEETVRIGDWVSQERPHWLEEMEIDNDE